MYLRGYIYFRNFENQYLILFENVPPGAHLFTKFRIKLNTGFILVRYLVSKWLHGRPSVNRYDVAKHTGRYIFGQNISHTFF